MSTGRKLWARPIFTSVRRWRHRKHERTYVEGTILRKGASKHFSVDNILGLTTPLFVDMFWGRINTNEYVNRVPIYYGGSTPESFQIQMGFSFPFSRANDLRSSLLNIRVRSYLLSCTQGVNTQG